MKKKNTLSELVTKGFFRKELKKELKEELANYPTKKDLRREMDSFESRMDAKMELKFDSFHGKIEQTLVTFRSIIFDHIDAFVKEVRDSHEERGIVANQVAEVREQVENHEERIAKLETAKAA